MRNGGITVTNRDRCISVINSMEEWQLQSVLEVLWSMKGAMEKLESGTLETIQILSDPELAYKLLAGKQTPLSECIPESEIPW